MADSSDSFRFTCPHCGKSIRVPISMQGRKAKCPGCAEGIDIPLFNQLTAQAPLVPPKLPPIIEIPASVVPSEPHVSVSPSHSTAVQVNVLNSSATNSLGISSLILGILSYFVCWIPLIGLAISGLGLVLGTIGLVISITRKGTGIGYSIAGAAISLLSVLIGITVLAATFGMADAIEKADGRSKASEQNSEFQTASEPINIGSIKATITEARIGKVPLYQRIMEEEQVSKEDLLLIRITIANTSKTKKIDYEGWMSPFASIKDIEATLTDDAGNNYRMADFGATVQVKDASMDNSIYPGKSTKDVVVFERPIDGAKYLDLTLSAEGCREDGKFRFRIPVEMIKR